MNKRKVYKLPILGIKNVITTMDFLILKIIKYIMYSLHKAKKINLNIWMSEHIS